MAKMCRFQGKFAKISIMSDGKKTDWARESIWKQPYPYLGPLLVEPEFAC